MKKGMFLLGFLAVVMGGCKTTGVPVDLYTGSVHSTISKETRSLPAKNTVVNASPGEPIVLTREVVVRDGIELLETVRVDGKYNGFTNTYIVKPGALVFVGSGQGGKFYSGEDKVNQIVETSGTNQFVDGGIFIPNSSDDGHSVFLDNYSAVIEPINRKVAFKKKDVISVPDDSLKQELVYTGKSGNDISLEYREYKGRIARPAFSQTLTFDISEDNVVGFRGALIEVLEAKNSGIRYKVIKNIGDK